jgi:polyphosphate kinase
MDCLHVLKGVHDGGDIQMRDESLENVLLAIAQTLRQQGFQQGMQQGMQQSMQQVLVMQLALRFRLTKKEKQFIGTVNELEKLTAALKLVITAPIKEEVLQSLKTITH